ncbi:hypothetical protein GJ496_004270 [Pomphorhynchus laevis]|nr:hypothetical protein GJ496_004270 [Pomphorhynchus laevis]
MDVNGCVSYTNTDEIPSQYNQQDFGIQSGSGYIGGGEDGIEGGDHSLDNAAQGHYEYTGAGGSQSMHADYTNASDYGEYAKQSEFGSGGLNGGVSSEYMDSSQIADHASSQIQNDPNPIVVKKKFPGPCTKYLQRICVRYLQPPNLPPPGPLIVKEVRDPQLPPPPPLCIKQKMPQPKTPPPLILRERPPPRPQIEASKVVCKRIPAGPPPKRQVIIERLPKLPPKPRDILIERWLPYPHQAKRKVIYQKAPPSNLHKQQKNLIIMYEGCTQVERMFRKLGVTTANPDQYIQQYGNELFDKVELENRAKHAGVHEDLTPPIVGHSHHAIQGNAYSEVGGAEYQYGEHNAISGSVSADQHYGDSSAYQHSGGFSAYQQHGDFTTQHGDSHYHDDTYGAISSGMTGGHDISGYCGPGSGAGGYESSNNFGSYSGYVQ